MRSSSVATRGSQAASRTVSYTHLAHLVDDEAVHDRGAAHGAERVGGIYLQVLERLGDQPHLAVPRVVRMVDRQIQVEVAAVPPHLELVAEHHLGGRLGTCLLYTSRCV